MISQTNRYMQNDKNCFFNRHFFIFGYLEDKKASTI